ncbi:MAG: ATP-dependent zinc metalloprotease FtsH [Planctomycetes bacterium]|nr:ATP-dependent zinc metalloprotease FtsH [Planctomycetota bacterium]
MSEPNSDPNTIAFASKKKPEKKLKKIDPPTPGSSGPPIKPRRQSVTWFTLGLLALLIWIVINGSSTRGRAFDTWQEFMVYAKEGKLEPKSVVILNDRIVAEVKPNTKGFAEQFGDKPAPVYVSIAPTAIEKYMKNLDEAGIPYRVDVGTSTFAQIAMTILPTLIILGILWFLLSRSMRNAGGGPGGMLGNFGRSKHRVSNKEMAHTTFADVAGIDEAKEEVSELVEFLKDPKRFQRLGGRIPRGVLLEGPPGCGKTLLAKAIAGEAEVPFFSISGSDFVEMFVGVGASRVRDLFKQAKDNSPCIIFLDEVDAVGRRRGGGFTTGGHDEREQTLNAILVEMDGFDANDQVIVIAATNRVDVLDPALTRPGRFDRTVGVQFPDVQGRRQILAVHAKKVKMGPDVNLERMARSTPMFSGADLAAIINEAAILATMLDKDFIEMTDMEEARDKIRFGRAKKSRRIEQQERVATAYHESGHAILQVLLPDADPLHKVTIIPRGQMLGVTFSLPEKDRYGFSRKYLLATMRVLCGGRIAEARQNGDVSSGAAMDIKMATAYARAMVLEWGMSERLGFVRYAGQDSRESFIPERDFSEDTAKMIDEEIRRLIDDAFKDAQRMVHDSWDKISALAEALLKYETLQVEDVQKIIRGEAFTPPTVVEMLSATTTPPVSPKPEPPAPDIGVMPSPA